MITHTMKTLVIVTISIFVMVLSSCVPVNQTIPTKTLLPRITFTITPKPTLITTATPTKMSSWHWSNALATFNDMAVLPDSEVWIVGQNGIIIHDRRVVAHLVNPYDFRGEYDFAGGGYISGVDFIAPDDGWLTAWGGQIYHWNGEEWLESVPYDFGNRVLIDIGFANKEMGWAVGCMRGSHTEALIMEWNGDLWENVTLSSEVRAGYCFEDIDVVSETSVWLVGSNYQTVILLHWNGSQWQKISTPPEMKSITSISAIDSSDVWIVGGNNVFYWDGSIWEQVEIPVYFWYGENDSASPDILALSRDNVWVGGKTLYHWNGNEWKDTDYDTDYGYIVDIEADSNGNIWALTLTGIILQLSER